MDAVHNPEPQNRHTNVDATIRRVNTPGAWGFILATAALLGYGFYVAYRKLPKSCAAGPACQACGSSRSLKVGLWIVTAVAIAGLVFERIEPHLQ